MTPEPFPHARREARNTIPDNFSDCAFHQTEPACSTYPIERGQFQQLGGDLCRSGRRRVFWQQEAASPRDGIVPCTDSARPNKEKAISTPSVLLIHPFDAIAGSQRVVLNIAQALYEAGYGLEVRLGFGSGGFVSRLRGVRRFLDVNRIALRKLLYPFWLLSIMPRVLRAAFGGEVVWANTVHAAPAVLAALLTCPRRVIIHVHEARFPGVLMRLLRYSRRRGATILCVSKTHREVLRLDAEVLLNCVTIETVDAPISLRTALIYVGSTSAEKGFALFIEVATCLSATDLVPVAFLPSDDRCDTAMVQAARSAGIRIEFGVTETGQMYDQAFLSLMCTDAGQCTETFSLVATESICHLVPVASAGSAVLKEIIGPALAFEAPDRDPNSIAAQILSLRADQARYERLVQACRDRRGDYAFERFAGSIRVIVGNLARGERP